MVSLLNLKGDETIFEPCAGDGIFIDSIIEKYARVTIEAYEFNDDSFKNLSVKYSDFDNISVKKTDTLTDEDLESFCATGGKYDAVIANPPYGAWKNAEERKLLKKRFSGFYAKESYSLFLHRGMEVLKEGGRLVFIIPDTYLNLHTHTKIRKYILTRTKINEIALFPSYYFPGVNFGYANLSIIALEKCSDSELCLNNPFKIIKGYKKVEELGADNLDHATKLILSQRDVLNNIDSAFLANADQKITLCLKASEKTIGDICDCVTGFYSGNDKKFLKVLNKKIRNSKRYDVVDADKVTFDCNIEMSDGIKGEKFFVPIVKGGNIKYFKPDNWFMEWSYDLVSFFKKDKKARYQNSSYYFKKGIAVPMVSSSSITGALIENRLFDQSIVGVFPKNPEWLYYLLSFFNSATCNKLIRTINPSANNSANYIKKIPFKLPSEDDLRVIKENTEQIVEQVKLSGVYDLNIEKENHKRIKDIYGF